MEMAGGGGPGQPTMLGDVIRGFLFVIVTLGGMFGAAGVLVGLLDRDLPTLLFYLVWSVIFAIFGALVFWWIKASRSPRQRGAAQGFSVLGRGGHVPGWPGRSALPARGLARGAASSGGLCPVPSRAAGPAPGAASTGPTPLSAQAGAGNAPGTPSAAAGFPPGAAGPIPPAFGGSPAARGDQRGGSAAGRPAPRGSVSPAAGRGTEPAGEARGRPPGAARGVGLPDPGSATTRASAVPQSDVGSPVTPPPVRPGARPPAHSPAAETQSDNLIRRGAPPTPPARPVAPSDPTIRQPFPDDR
ncbi:hypothetical protein AB0L62_02515 [Nocardia asteroides]|uniref:hypothetical protein n=1 Tax=Nocardia asteroides TaxID=1824 RepID=UPI003433C5CD